MSIFYRLFQTLVHYPQWLSIYLVDYFRQHAPGAREEWLDKQAWRSARDALFLPLGSANSDDIFKLVDQMAKPTIGELKRALALEEFEHLLMALARAEREREYIGELIQCFGEATQVQEYAALLGGLGDDDRIPASISLEQQQTPTGWARREVLARLRVRERDVAEIERDEDEARLRRLGVHLWMLKLAREVSAKVLADRVRHLDTALPEAKPSARRRF